MPPARGLWGFSGPAPAPSRFGEGRLPSRAAKDAVLRAVPGEGSPGPEGTRNGASAPSLRLRPRNSMADATPRGHGGAGDPLNPPSPEPHPPRKIFRGVHKGPSLVRRHPRSNRPLATLREEVLGVSSPFPHTQPALPSVSRV